MTLGEIIKNYRNSHSLSMDAFSERSGISKAYISLLEKNKHPKTGKEIAPSLQCIKQAADGMNMDFNELFSMLDCNVAVNTPNSSLTEKDNRDIAKDLENIMRKLDSSEDGPASYDGKDIPDDDREMFAAQLEIMLRRLKTINKEKYNPNKNKK